MVVRYDYATRSYEVKEKLSNGQTLLMLFQEMDDIKKNNEIYYNVVLGVYNKRKHAISNELNARITGENPMETVFQAVKAFKMLEKRVWRDAALKNKNVSVIVSWIDNRRRDAYYSYLSRQNFYFSQYCGKKVLIKRYTLKDYHRIHPEDVF